MKRKELGAIPDFWPRTVKTARRQEKPENQYLELILLLVFIVSYPFFLPFMATWMLWWFK